MLRSENMLSQHANIVTTCTAAPGGVSANTPPRGFAAVARDAKRPVGDGPGPVHRNLGDKLLGIAMLAQPFMLAAATKQAHT